MVEGKLKIIEKSHKKKFTNFPDTKRGCVRILRTLYGYATDALYDSHSTFTYYASLIVCGKWKNTFSCMAYISVVCDICQMLWCFR